MGTSVLASIPLLFCNLQFFIKVSFLLAEIAHFLILFRGLLTLSSIAVRSIFPSYYCLLVVVGQLRFHERHGNCWSR